MTIKVGDKIPSVTLQHMTADGVAGITTDEIYVMRFLVATSDNKLREKFLKEKDPTMTELMNIARNHEISNASLKAMNDGASANAMTTRNNDNYSKAREARVKEIQEQGLCFRCGEEDVDKNHHCPAKKATCNKCTKTGHFAAVCLNTLGDNTQRSSRGRSPTPGPRQRGRSSSSTSPDGRATANSILVRSTRPPVPAGHGYD